MDNLVSLSEARDGISDLIEKVSNQSARYTITKRGKEAVAIVPMSDLNLLRELETYLEIEEAAIAFKEADEKGTISLDDLKSELGLE